MPKATIVDVTGKKVGDMELSEAVFGAKVNPAVLHQAVVAHLANRRQGTQSTLTRSEVRGGGKKPWRQKGTGRARQGSTRAPQWTHGGIALGPKPRTYRIALNKKTKRMALQSALSLKVRDSEIIIIDKLEMDAIKTKRMAEILAAVGAGKALVVLPGADRNIVMSARNIAGVKTTPADNLNVYDILRHDKLVVIKDAVKTIEEVYA